MERIGFWSRNTLRDPPISIDWSPIPHHPSSQHLHRSLQALYFPVQSILHVLSGDSARRRRIDSERRQAVSTAKWIINEGAIRLNLVPQNYQVDIRVRVKSA